MRHEGNGTDAVPAVQSPDTPADKPREYALKRNYPVGVLVLEPSKEAAEALVNGLRRTGLRLRPRWVNRPGMLAEFLRAQPWDLLLAGLDEPVVPPAQVVEVVRRCDCDLAIVGLTANNDGDNPREDALRAGFHDVVPLAPVALLEHAVSRELESLDQRRLVRSLKTGLQASTRTLRELIHTSERALAVVHGGQILQANATWMELMAVSPGEDPRGRPFSDYVAAEDREAFSRLLAEQAEAPNPMVEIELIGLRADGEIIPLFLDIVPGIFEERAGLLVTARGPAPAATPAAPQEIAAAVDGHRRSLVQAIDADLGANAGGVLACIQIENQQKLDEVLGLAGSDRLAEDLLQRIRGHVTPDAVVARVSDDTFGIYLRQAGIREGHEQADRIAAAISRDVIRIDEHAVRAACLIGVAPAAEHAGGMAVLEAAYTACRAPAVAGAGVNQAAGYETAMRYEEIAEDLVAAMSDGRLSLVFQPIVRLRGEPIDLYEVFIRLRDRQGAAVPTRAVISAARQQNLDADLDLWVIRRAVAILETRRQQGRDTHLFVKLSDQCMDHIETPLTITRELKARNVPPRNLIVELSETAASGNLNKSSAFVQSLQEIGCSTALDHFGLSLSAFQLLEDVPAAYLKLDASLVNRLAEDADAYKQVAEICRRANDLGKHTIASYLDNPQCLPKLYEAGVDFAQGYYIQEPGETMDFEFSILVE